MRLFVLFLLSCICIPLFSQVSDDFSDGDFTGNPTWYGDRHKFEIDKNYQLHLSAEREAGSARLFTPSTRTMNTTWDFHVQMATTPSDNNYTRIYLCADTTATGRLYGLCLRIGERKQIALWSEPASGSGRNLLRGNDDRLNIPKVSMQVKAVWSAAGTFSLYTRLAGEVNYLLEGTVDLSEIATNRFFGIYCSYTMTRHQNFLYFDDISISAGENHPSIIDIDPDDPDDNDMVGELAEPLDVIINEVLYQPDSPVVHEYVELYNRSQKSLALSMLSIATRRADGSLQNTKQLKSNAPALAPGEYLLVTGIKEAVQVRYGLSCTGTVFSELGSMIPLADAGSTIVVLNNKTGQVIDELTYNKNMHAAGISDAKGVALERIDTEQATNNANNWSSAIAEVGYATPGCLNSIARPGGTSSALSGISIVEPNPDFGINYFEIRYTLETGGARCNIYVFNLAGKLIEQVSNNMLLGTEGALTWKPEAGLNRGLYIIYVEVYWSEGRVAQFKSPIVVR